jgi:hypothetical protein
MPRLLRPRSAFPTPLFLVAVAVLGAALVALVVYLATA